MINLAIANYLINGTVPGTSKVNLKTLTGKTSKISMNNQLKIPQITARLTTTSTGITQISKDDMYIYTLKSSPSTIYLQVIPKTTVGSKFTAQVTTSKSTNYRYISNSLPTLVSTYTNMTFTRVSEFVFSISNISMSFGSKQDVTIIIPLSTNFKNYLKINEISVNLRVTI